MIFLERLVSFKNKEQGGINTRSEIVSGDINKEMKICMKDLANVYIVWFQNELR